MDSQLVVLGGGPGGYAAAFMAADLGLQVTLVDREPRLGGVCLLRGCIPSKALLHVAKAMNEARHLEDWGVGYGKPKIDLAAMRARKEKVIATLSGGLNQLAKQRNVRVVRATGAFENSQTLRLAAVDGEKLDDERIRFEHCILASGSRAATIPNLDLQSPRVLNSRTGLELPDVPETLLIIGGGYIGLEMGTVYAALGSRVSVVEMTDGLLPGADRDLVRPLHKRLEKQFDGIFLNSRVVALKERSKDIEVTFEGVVEQKVQRFSRVLIAVGRKPNSDSIGLENTKIELDKGKFVVVDSQQQTAEPHILAIGDVAGQPMLAHKAAHEGKVAAHILAGKQAEFAPRAIPAVVFTDPEVAWAGIMEEDAKKSGRQIETAAFPWAASGRAQAVGRTEGLTKWIVDPPSQRVIGCGIVGAGAGDLISEAVLAIEMGAHLEDVVESIHPHPTLSETLAGAAEVFFGTATDIYRPRKSK